MLDMALGRRETSWSCEGNATKNGIAVPHRGTAGLIKDRQCRFRLINLRAPQRVPSGSSASLETCDWEKGGAEEGGPGSNGGRQDLEAASGCGHGLGKFTRYTETLRESTLVKYRRLTKQFSTLVK